MLIWTTRFSRKKAVLAVLALGVAAAAVIFLLGRTPSTNEDAAVHLETNEDRVAYLEGMGWAVVADLVETLQFLLPEKLVEPYLTYNELQDAQGFDLARACGKQVSRYTYTVTNYPGRTEGVQANLYVCEETPVAGDILCPGSDGFQETLVFPQTTG